MGNNDLTANCQRYPQPGDRVKIIQKQDYSTGELTAGVVERVLTKSRYHRRGHKVRLTTGIIGRVQAYIEKGKEPIPPDSESPSSHLDNFDPDHDLR